MKSDVKERSGMISKARASAWISELLRDEEKEGAR
jgi:hypothetical protein